MCRYNSQLKNIFNVDLRIVATIIQHKACEFRARTILSKDQIWLGVTQDSATTVVQHMNLDMSQYQFMLDTLETKSFLLGNLIASTLVATFLSFDAS